MRTLIRELELDLMSAPTRADAAKLRTLLHPEFVEIGRSGRRWTREPIIESLLAHPREQAPTVDEWEFTHIADDLLLVTYRTDDGERVSRHSSLWDTAGTTPVMRFHQGTVVPD
ncbi:nuclear transport factor 2 family protein [Tsukamurella asaccharolytica]|uniref:Nuclear transport factor 2 family protein n=1 Tax=Tsukamurella asaccharolytica TaxID=2592067 RepID=A0A5C5R4F7_9ACTN|nr:nuclear transport factor 2 family protein [Tsukamurella asaccharolytica]TWS17658.1 nuclear transport factor 2 family protein [Tsukamurella asaccharolytica]